MRLLKYWKSLRKIKTFCIIAENKMDENRENSSFLQKKKAFYAVRKTTDVVK